MIIKFSVWSECGYVRKYNEDNADVFANEYGMILGIVCDGMGGHYGGKTASTVSVNYIKDAFLGMKFNINPEFLTKEDIILWAQNTIDELSVYIREYAEEHEDHIDMGTTLVAAIYFNEVFYILNIGDSRAYYVLKDQVKQITEDHNVKNLLSQTHNVDLGRIMGPDHALTSALGPIKKYMLDLFTVKAVEGYVMLASDGFYNYISEAKIRDILIEDRPLPDKAKKLINEAIEKSNDNLSVVLLEVIKTKENNA